MLPTHNDSSYIKGVLPVGFFFSEIYSSQGQGDNNSYRLITPNYLFLFFPFPPASASVICYLGFSQPPLALSIQLNSKVFEENSCGFLEF